MIKVEENDPVGGKQVMKNKWGDILEFFMKFRKKNIVHMSIVEHDENKKFIQQIDDVTAMKNMWKI